MLSSNWTPLPVATEATSRSFRTPLAYETSVNGILELLFIAPVASKATEVCELSFWTPFTEVATKALQKLSANMNRKSLGLCQPGAPIRCSCSKWHPEASNCCDEEEQQVTLIPWLIVKGILTLPLMR
jgi:hypothetical protein